MVALLRRIVGGLVTILLIASVLFFNFNNFLLLVSLLFIISLLATREMVLLFGENNTSKLVYLSPILLFVEYIENCKNISFSLTSLALLLLVSAILISETFIGSEDNFKETINRDTVSLTISLFPSFFATYLVKVAFFSNALLYLILFFIIIFSTDTGAYVFGILLGKSNRGFVKVSPKKSIAGFIGGVILPLLSSSIYFHFIQNKLTLSLTKVLTISLLLSIAAEAGDLVESSFKRSKHVKDSGNIIMGRGGLLDSIDSSLLSCPVFFLLLSIFL